MQAAPADAPPAPANKVRNAFACLDDEDASSSEEEEEEGHGEEDEEEKASAPSSTRIARTPIVSLPGTFARLECGRVAPQAS